jgi:hypothetical protein
MEQVFYIVYLLNKINLFLNVIITDKFLCSERSATSAVAL